MLRRGGGPGGRGGEGGRGSARGDWRGHGRGDVYPDIRPDVRGDVRGDWRGSLRRRVSSSTWSRSSRSSPTTTDTIDLNNVGLPSKGDNRLLDHKTQETYYAKIVERYMRFCAEAREPDELLRRLALLSVSDGQKSLSPFPQPLAATTSLSQVPSPRSSDPEHQKDLGDILFALRRLREGIVASNRADLFALTAYMFCIRLAILVRHPPTYYPAILHVLRRFSLVKDLLSVAEKSEVNGYLILDTACRRRNLAEAYELRGRYKLKGDGTVDEALAALVHDDYVSFRRLKRFMDGYKVRLMDYADDDMRLVTLKCFGRAYMSVDRPFLETCTGKRWTELKKDDGVGWDLAEGDKVIIKKPKQSSTS